MNPRYNFSVKFYLEHGNDKPTLSELRELEAKANSMASLVFGEKLIDSPDVLVIEDEEKEQDYTVYTAVTVTLNCSLTATAECTHDAGCIAEGLLDDIGDSISLNTDDSGIELGGIIVDSIKILGVEEIEQG